MSDIQHDEAHTGPIKTPKQLLWTVIFSFVVPVFAIIGLVMYVTAANKPGAGAADESAQIASRLQKVGSVEIRDANRPVKKSTRHNAPPATQPAQRALPSLKTPQPGPRASKPGWKHWSTPRSPAKAPWRHKVVAILTMWKSPAVWFIWPMQLEPSSRFLSAPLHLQPMPKQRQPQPLHR